jgi:protein-disulfide isomerase
MKPKTIISVLFVLVVLGVVYLVASTPPQTQAAPDILKAYIGKPVFLEFMNPSCSHCLNMVPVLNALYLKYGSTTVFLSVSSGTPQATQQFITTYHTPWTYTQDPNGAVFAKYGVQGTPTFVLVDSKGQIARTFVGETSYSDLASALQEVA